MAEKKKKEKTINDLAESMEKGFKRADERLEASINNLALMIGKGFEHVDQRMDSMDQRMDSLDQRMDSLDQRMDSMEKTNSREHEDMMLRLDSSAYRFELVDLKKRVEVLENKAVMRV